MNKPWTRLYLVCCLSWVDDIERSNPGHWWIFAPFRPNLLDHRFSFAGLIYHLNHSLSLSDNRAHRLLHSCPGGISRGGGVMRGKTASLPCSLTQIPHMHTGLSTSVPAGAVPRWPHVPCSVGIHEGLGGHVAHGRAKGGDPAPCGP